MGHAYTPGLRVTPRALLRKRRILPIKGKVLATTGARVRAEDTVAETHLPGKVKTVNIINSLGILPREIRDYMTKREGDRVHKDEVIAASRPLIRWFRTEVKSPMEGSIETVSEVTGQVLLREPPQALTLQAYIDGQVIEVLPEEGVVVETRGAFIQGIFGIGGEVVGPIAMAVDAPDQPLTADRIRPEHKGHVVVGGAFAGAAAFRRAREVGVVALVVGGSNDQDIRDLLGYDLGVAITGTERVGFTLILTEGFGQIAMAGKTHDLLATLAGHRASVNGATQIRAGVMRPEIIVPREEPAGVQAEGEGWERGALRVGDPVRIIREPYFGRIGRVKDLPQELTTIPTETKVRILVAEFPDGEVARVPRANVEIIEG